MRFRCIFAAAAGWALISSTLRGDLIVLKDGSYRAGRVTVTAGEIRLRTTNDIATEEEIFPAGEIALRLSGAKEAAELDRITSAPQLVQLAQEYHAVGLQMLATRCVVRAVDRDTSLTQKPMESTAAAWRDFWNRTILRERLERAASQDSAGQIELARWARGAGLNDDAVRLLRRAYRFDPHHAGVIELARTWNVDLRPLIRIDLTAAINQSLIFSNLVDEEQKVTPRTDADFIVIPFQYQRDEAAEIRRAEFEAKAIPTVMCRVVGFRPIRWQAGRAELTRGAGDPIYERMQIQMEGGKPALFGVNTTGPLTETGREGGNRTRSGRIRLTCNGWASVILEVHRGASRVQLNVPRSGPQEIDLGLLRLIGEGMDEATLPGSVKLATLVKYVTHSSEPVAVLAIRQLDALRARVTREQYATWSEQIDPALTTVLALANEEVQREAWRCLVDFGDLTRATQDGIASAGAILKRQLLPFVGEEFAASPARSAVVLNNACIVMGGLLKSVESDVVRPAVELLARGAPQAACDGLIGGSTLARSLATGRCRSIDDLAIRERILRGLIPTMTEADAGSAASLISSTRMTILVPSDPLIARLQQTQDESTRAGMLAALHEVSMTPILRSPAFAEILRDALAPRSVVVRRQAMRLALRQAALRGKDDVHGAFPMSAPRGDLDPLARTLGALVRDGDSGRRAEALLAVIRDGDAFGADELMQATSEEPETWARTLKQVVDLSGAEGIDAIYSWLFRLLSHSDALEAAILFHTLDQLTKSRGDGDRFRVNLAAKTGMSWSSLATFSCSNDEKLAAAASRWIVRLAHLSAQDRQQYFALRERNDRMTTLRNSSNRCGRVASDRYGVLLVTEWTTPVVSASDPTVRFWQPPWRVTLNCGEIEVRGMDLGREIRAYRGEKLVGMGTAYASTSALPRAEDFIPQMELAPADIAAACRPPTAEGMLAPYLLGSEEQSSSGAPGTLKIDIAELLRDTLRQDRTAAACGLTAAAIVPSRLEVSAHYVGFGSYFGVGTRRVVNTAPIVSSAAPAPMLVNVLLMLERFEGQPANATAAGGPAGVNPQSPLPKHR